MHKNYPNISIKGLVDGDYLFDEEAKQYAEGIVQYYQGDNLRWEFPVNPFMKGSKKWNEYEKYREIVINNEEDFAREVFKGDKSQTSMHYGEMVIIREVITW
jgi:hypothetical protein